MKLAPELHNHLENFFREFYENENLQLPDIEIFGKRGAKLITSSLKIGGITFGRFIFIRPGLLYRDGRAKIYISKELLAHEAAHTLQYQKLGAARFLYAYLKSFFNSLHGKKSWDFFSRMEAYLEIPFEKEARKAGSDFVLWISFPENRKRKTKPES